MRFLPPAFAIGLSVMMIVVVLNVSNGMIQGIIMKFTETGIYHIRAHSRNVYSAEELHAFRTQLLSHPFITQIGFEYDTIALLSANNIRQGVSVRAISAETWRDDPAFRENITVVSGTLKLSDQTDIMIGNHIANQMGIEVGDVIELISVRRLATIVIPRITTHRVQGIFSAGYRDLDRMWVLLPFEHAHDYLALENVETVIGIKVADLFGLPNPIIRTGNIQIATDTLQSVRQQLRGHFTVQTWFQFRPVRFLSFRSTKNILLFIMVLIIMVAMLHLASSLNMLVVEKRADIAYLKCVGASEYQIRTIFINCGFFIGSGGAFLGILLGLFISIHINSVLRIIEYILAQLQRIGTVEHGINFALLRTEIYLEKIPIILSVLEITLIFAITLLCSVVVAVFPAQKSARINPMQILADTSE